MTVATRTALERVSQILHDAGWDAPAAPPPELTELEFQAIRGAYAHMLRPDDLAVIQKSLGEGGQDAPKTRLTEALARLVGFAQVAGAHGVGATSR